MCYYIGIEDLAANALINALKENKRFLSYSVIEKYGNSILRFLYDKGETAVLVFSRESTTSFLHNYSDIFVEREENGVLGIALKESVERLHLIKKFQSYLAIDLLSAFLNSDITNELSMVSADEQFESN